MIREVVKPQLERVKFELRATGVKENHGNPLRSGTHTRGYLPHVKREGAGYFVTFRLADSLPKEVFLRIQEERATKLAQLFEERPRRENDQSAPVSKLSREMNREYFRKMEEYLDKGLGHCWLRRPEIADKVAEVLRFFDGQRYVLKAWVIMPTHVHAVVWPMPGHTLSKITQSWKRHAAREANRLLGRLEQSFWQAESYDHWIRNEVEHDRCCRYVINNPVKARLCARARDWKWSSAWEPAA